MEEMDTTDQYSTDDQQYFTYIYRSTFPVGMNFTRLGPGTKTEK